MIEVFGEHYFIDIDKIEQFINIPKTEPVSGDTNEQHISVVKYEVVKTMIEVIMGEDEEFDDNLGLKSAKGSSLPFKLAFNTMLKHKLIEHL
jgi:hypothetical protein